MPAITLSTLSPVAVLGPPVAGVGVWLLLITCLLLCPLSIEWRAVTGARFALARDTHRLAAEPVTCACAKVVPPLARALHLHPSSRHSARGNLLHAKSTRDSRPPHRSRPHPVAEAVPPQPIRLCSAGSRCRPR